MMIVMQPGAETAEVEAVRARLAQTGVHVVVMPGELTTAIGAIGDPAGVAELGLEGMAGVDRVVPISRPYKLASSELSHHEPSRFDIAGRTVGGGATFCLIAGPCTVESSEQTMAVAAAVRAGGASMLRGGAFKPRTSPFAFKGMGAAALEILADAREQTGLPIVTELLDAEHAPAACTACATASVCSRDSTVHGPAIRQNVDPPPTVRPAMSNTDGASWLSSELASLYGRLIGTTRSTPSSPSRPSSATPCGSPMAPIAVVSSPGMTTTCTPVVARRSRTASICSTVAPGVMTIIIGGLPSRSSTGRGRARRARRRRGGGRARGGP